MLWSYLVVSIGTPTRLATVGGCWIAIRMADGGEAGFGRLQKGLINFKYLAFDFKDAVVEAFQVAMVVVLTSGFFVVVVRNGMLDLRESELGNGN